MSLNGRYIIYEKLGFQDRYAYFEALSRRFNIPTMEIILKAEQLGIEQDFEELLNWLLRVENAIRQSENK